MHRHSIWYSKFIGYLIYEYDAQNIVRLEAHFTEMLYFYFLQIHILMKLNKNYDKTYNL
jgi:hypothetical protein